MADFSCKICYDAFNKSTQAPITLNCGHSFCLRCIGQIGQDQREIVCSLCRKKTTCDYRTLGKNITLIEIMEQNNLLGADPSPTMTLEYIGQTDLTELKQKIEQTALKAVRLQATYLKDTAATIAQNLFTVEYQLQCTTAYFRELEQQLSQVNGQLGHMERILRTSDRDRNAVNWRRQSMALGQQRWVGNYEQSTSNGPSTSQSRGRENNSYRSEEIRPTIPLVGSDIINTGFANGGFRGSARRRRQTPPLQQLPNMPIRQESARDMSSWATADSGWQPEKPYKLLRIEASKIPKFSLTEIVSEFEMDKMAERPLDDLQKAIDEQIQMAILKSEELYDGRKVEQFSILLFGYGLDNPVSLPLRAPPQNSAEVLMAELEKLSQSEGEDNMDKRTLLLSHPVRVIITCAAPPAGSAKVHFDAQTFWGLNEAQRIRVNNLTGPECLFYALILGFRFMNPTRIRDLNKEKKPVPADLMDRMRFHRFKNNINRQRIEVDEMMTGAGIIRNNRSYGIQHLDAIQEYWDTKYERLYRIVAFEYAPEIKPRPIWKGDGPRPYNIFIFLQNNHWDAIKKVHRFFAGIGANYCVDCEVSYDRGANHRIGCKARCYNCGLVRNGQCPPQPEFMLECPDCHRFYFSQSCFDEHKPETCRIWRRCAQCDHVFKFNNKDPHVCNTRYCRQCKIYHEKEPGCFLQKVVLKKRTYRICVYDIETRQNDQLDERTRLHVPNFISMRITCTRCEDGEYQACCEICGPIREKEWSEPEGDDCLGDFTEWLLTAFDRKYTTYIWAHNASRFDSHFVYHYLCTTGRCPETSMQGLKLFEFKVQQAEKYSKLIFRDSYLLMGIPLADLPSTFQLDVQSKMHFPHMYNRPENYDRQLNHLPPIDDYCPDSMSEEKHRAFFVWYQQNQTMNFHLPSELREYCRNDSEILLKALLAFRRIFLTQVTNGADPLPISSTLASLCMNIYKSMFMAKDQIALVPERGYERSDRSSVLAIKYLEYRALRENIQIQHAGNGLEKRYKNYKLDGWIAEQNKCIEILGCFYHGCLICYNPSDELVDKRTAMDLNERTRQRIFALKKPDADGNTIEVEEIWECQIRKELKEAEKTARKAVGEDEYADEQPDNGDEMTKNMHAFFNDLGNEKGPIDPRKAYFGGRCGPVALHAKSGNDMELSFFDIISLYPSVNFKCTYPIGIPEIIRPHPAQLQVYWIQPEQIPYRGLLKVRVIPPRGLLLPVLPMKQDERLLFSCCYRCARKFRYANTRQPHLCFHNDAERAFVTTTTHIELMEALRHGYVVDRFIRAWHYTQWTDTLFTDYVRHFLRLKVQASGFPTNVQSETEKQQFMQQYQDMGVIIDIEQMQYNPGLRFISKNMFKFSMDTDSLIIQHQRGLPPLPSGTLLGEMQPEYEKYEILEFCAGGAKQYAIHLRHRQTGEEKFLIRIRKRREMRREFTQYTIRKLYENHRNKFLRLKRAEMYQQLPEYIDLSSDNDDPLQPSISAEMCPEYIDLSSEDDDPQQPSTSNKFFCVPIPKMIGPKPRQRVRFCEREEVALPNDVLHLSDNLNDGQKRVFTIVISSLLGNQPQRRMFMLHGEGGCGKSYVYQRISDACLILGLKVILCASTGVAATVLAECTTVHSAFGLSIFGADNSEESNSANTNIAEKNELIKQAQIIIIDEISMLDVHVLDAVDLKLQNLMALEVPFGGKHILLGGDRMQIIPVGGAKKSIYASSKYMGQFYHVELVEQMRQSGDPEYTKWIRQLGRGTQHFMRIPSDSVVESIKDLIIYVYGSEVTTSIEHFGLIIAATNKAVNEVNTMALNMMPGVEEIFESVDGLPPSANADFEDEFSNFAPKYLKLKPGAIVILLKNLNIGRGLANGSRLIYRKKIGNDLEFADFNQPDRLHRIKKVKLTHDIPKASGGGRLTRTQYPVCLAFCTTIHKAQSQTVENLGLYMQSGTSMFADGMCYTAMSRLRSGRNLRIYAPGPQGRLVLLRNRCTPFARDNITEDGIYLKRGE